MTDSKNKRISGEFQKAALNGKRLQKLKVPQPFSIRFSDEERALLKRGAGKLSLAAYIRQRLFRSSASPRKTKRPVRRQHRPTIDQQVLSKLLGTLGSSRLSSNMNQIAKAAHMGALPVMPELVDELHQACADIRAMRTQLIAALGIKPEESK